MTFLIIKLCLAFGKSSSFIETTCQTGILRLKNQVLCYHCYLSNNSDSCNLGNLCRIKIFHAINDLERGLDKIFLNLLVCLIHSFALASGLICH